MAIPIWIAASVGVTGVLLSRVDYNMFFMKFFRNLSRSKARARLHGNKYAMIPVMLGIEEPIKIDDDINAENAMTVTRELLEEMDGFDGTPLFQLKEEFMMLALESDFMVKGRSIMIG